MDAIPLANITKEVSTNDARVYQIHLTEKAQSVIPKARKLQAKWLEEVTSDLTDIEKNIFLQLISKTASKAARICEDL